MGVYLSPGVYQVTRDLSQYPVQVSTNAFGIVGGFTKGPVNELTYITSISELVDTFGSPVTQAGMAGYNYLRDGNSLWVVRVADSNVAYASGTLDDSSGDPTLDIQGKTPGTWANGIVVYTQPATGSGVKILVEVDGYVEEIFDDVTKSNFEDVVNAESKYINLVDNYNSNTNDPDSGQTIVLSGGNDGIDNLQAADYIGTVSGDTYTGLQLFRDYELHDIDMIAVPGISDASVINAGIEVCEHRQDCIYLADPPQGLTTQEVVDWHNGQGPWAGQHAAFNSSFGALFWSWHYMYNPYTKQKEWIAPSGVTAQIMAYSERVSEVWYAPAGFYRGRVLLTEQLEVYPDQGKRDLLYGSRNAVNPYTKFNYEGIVLFGQKTLQRLATALDRINVRRLHNYLTRRSRIALRQYLFEPNTAILWDRIKLTMESILGPIQAAQGIESYTVICDETTNTPEVRDRNELRVVVQYVPVKAAEIIELRWDILSSTASLRVNSRVL